MKRFTLNKQYAMIAFYVFAVIVISLLFALLVFRIGDIVDFADRAVDAVKAIPYGIAFALILYPFLSISSTVYSRIFERKRPHPRLVSVFSMLTTYLGMFIVLGVLLLGIIPPMIGTVGELYATLSDALTRATDFIKSSTASNPFLAEMADRALYYLQEGFTDILGDDIPGLVTRLLTEIVGEAFNILVGLVISIYLLSGRHLLSSIFGKLATALLPSGGFKRVSMFIKRLYSNITEFLSARILSALFLGIAAYLLFWVFGIPYHALLALIIVVCNLFPVFGTIFSLLFCGLVILITRPAYTLPMLGILIALELVDNLLIEPRTIRHKPLRQNVGSTIVLLLCGYALFGLIGAMLAIPVFATIQNALRAFTVHLLNRRHLPSAREEYQSFNMREYMPSPATAADVAENAPTEPDTEAPPAEGDGVATAEIPPAEGDGSDSPQ